jgi:hypothetical protein
VSRLARGHDNAVLATGSQIHAIETGTAQGNQADTTRRQAGNHLGIQPVIDKGTDGIHIVHQLQRVTVESRLKIAQLMTKLLIGTFQAQAVVILGIENSNAHGDSLRNVGCLAV